MASAIVKNQKILKFGYSFKQAAARNKADRAIIRNNEIRKFGSIFVVVSLLVEYKNKYYFFPHNLTITWRQPGNNPTKTWR